MTTRSNYIAILRLVVFCILSAGPRTRAAELNYQVSWVGNSWSGKTAWVQQDIYDLCVSPGGELFTNTIWDEGGNNCEQIKDGVFIRAAHHSHGWWYNGGQAVAANQKYVYISQEVESPTGRPPGLSYAPVGKTWSGVTRRLRSDITKGAAFEGGKGDVHEGDVLGKSYLPVEILPAKSPGQVRGIAVTDSLLYVSAPADNYVAVFDAQTMQPMRTVLIDRPDRIALDKSGGLYVLQAPAEQEPWKAVCFNADGMRVAPDLVFEPGVHPTAICFDSRGRLFVADAGVDQQVKVFDHGKQVEAIGEKGGILAGRPAGKFGDLRFNHPCAIGLDAADNLYIASGGSSAFAPGGAAGSTVLECYTPKKSLRWRLLGLEFMDIAAADEKEPSAVYTKEERFTLDYNKPAGQEWSYSAYTVNTLKYPEDPRLYMNDTTPAVRWIDGSKFLFLSDAYGQSMQVFRFNPATDGEIAIPAAMFVSSHKKSTDWPPGQPAKGEWIWRDRNGDGKFSADEYQGNTDRDAAGIPWVDATGSLWQNTGKTILCLPIGGLDVHGIPIWDFATARTWPVPDEFDEVRRLNYSTADDVMLLGGNKGDLHNQHWKPMGPLLCCYDHWTGTRQLRWRTVLPLVNGAAHHESREPISFDVAGDYIFAAYTRGLPDEKIQYAFVKVYRISDGTFVGNFVPERTLGEAGLLDLVQSLSAVRRSNGEYVVFLEDDQKSKVIMFRWKP